MEELKRAEHFSDDSKPPLHSIEVAHSPVTVTARVNDLRPLVMEFSEHFHLR